MGSILSSGDWLRGLLGVSIVIVLSVLVLGFLVNRTDRRWAWPVFVGYFVHLTFGLVLGWHGPRGNDAQWYDRFSLETLRYRQGDGQPPSEIFDDRAAFISLTSTTYQVFGHTVAPMIALNALAVVLTVLTAAHIVRLLEGGYAAQNLTLWASLLMPALMVWSKDLLREPYVFLFTLLACYGAVRATRGRSWLLWTLLPLLLLAGFRDESALVLALALMPALLSAWRKFPATLTLIPIAGAVALPLFALAAAVGSVSDRELAPTDLGSTPIQPATDLLVDPLSLLRALAGPFPWEWSGPLLFLSVDAIFCLVALRYAWASLKAIQPFASFLALALPFLMLIVAASLGAYNYGLVVRLRSQAYVCLLPLAAIGWHYIRMRGPISHPGSERDSRRLLPRGSVAS